MKRIGTICAAVAVASMVLTAGCGKIFPKPQTTTSTEKPMNLRPVVIIETSMGTIKAELWADSAPITVKNFLKYTDEKHYDGLIFHRVMQGFMIQGGGFDPSMKEKPTHAPIKNEASTKKKNNRGTLAMARTRVVDSATSQFYINLTNNEFLNHRDKTPDGFGYCTFGKVLDGMKVVDKIAAVRVGNTAGHQNVPVTPVIIKSIRLGK